MAEIEAELARLRACSGGGDPAAHQRTSVMTHVAWVPPAWLEAAEGTLAGMEARHPSRTVLLVPEPSAEGGIDARLWVRCFPVADREICGEVIELRLRGDRARAPASIVVPLAITDLPLSLRWRGEPPFESRQWLELVEVADRVVIDSSEWGELRYAELAEVFERSVVSDITWARIHPWRVALARRWPAIGFDEIEVAGPPAEAALVRGWLATRLGRELGPPVEAGELAVLVGGEAVAPVEEEARSPSDLLSAELDRMVRDPIYEEAVRDAALPGSAPV